MKRKIKEVISAIAALLIILSVLCLIYWGIGYGFFYLLINSTGNREIKEMNSKWEKRLEDYEVYLPEEYEYIDGYVNAGLDNILHLYFRVSKEDFEGMLGESWKVVNSGEEKNEYRHDGDWIEVEGTYYKCGITGELYYNIVGDYMECYINLWLDIDK